MLKETLKSHIMVEYKWMGLLKLLTVCMFIAAVYAFVSVKTGVPASAIAAQPLENKSITESQQTEDALYAYVGGDRSYANKILRTLGKIHLAEMPDISEIKVKDNS